MNEIVSRLLELLKATITTDDLGNTMNYMDFYSEKIGEALLPCLQVYGENTQMFFNHDGIGRGDFLSISIYLLLNVTNYYDQFTDPENVTWMSALQKIMEERTVPGMKPLSNTVMGVINENCTLSNPDYMVARTEPHPIDYTLNESRGESNIVLARFPLDVVISHTCS